jgi:hypothetical protein
MEKNKMAVRLNENFGEGESALFAPDGSNTCNDLRVVKTFEDSLGGRDGGEKRVFIVFQELGMRCYVLKISIWKGTPTLSWLTLKEFYGQHGCLNDGDGVQDGLL